DPPEALPLRPPPPGRANADRRTLPGTLAPPRGPRAVGVPDRAADRRAEGGDRAVPAGRPVGGTRRAHGEGPRLDVFRRQAREEVVLDENAGAARHGDSRGAVGGWTRRGMALEILARRAGEGARRISHEREDTQRGDRRGNR